MASLNKVILIGRLTADPELKQTTSGVFVVRFSVGVNRRREETDENGQKVRKTDFFNVIAWRERAEFVSRYFKKGSSIYVNGEMQTRKYTDNQGITRYVSEIVADDVRFVDAKGTETAPAQMPQNHIA